MDSNRDKKEYLEKITDLQNLAQIDLKEDVIEEKLSYLRNKYGAYKCFCNKICYQKDTILNHLSNCANLSNIIEKLKKDLLNYDPMEDFKNFLKSYNYQNVYSSTFYQEENDLNGLENDILYHIHKYQCLSAKELRNIFKMDQLDLYKVLKDLCNLGFINRNEYGRSFIYFHDSIKSFEVRKKIIRDLVKESLDLGIPKIKTYHILKDEKICFDMHIINECIKEIEYDIIIDYELDQFIKKNDVYRRNYLRFAIPKIKRLIQKLNVPENIMQDAVKIYTNILKENLLKGRSIINMVTASVYSALRIHGIPQSIDEIIAIDNIKKKSFMKSYRTIIKNIYPKLNFKTQIFTPEDYVVKFCKQLEISSECEKAAKNLIEMAKNQNLIFGGKDPRGFAAASIYLITLKACNERRTQKEIARVANITEVTLRQRVKDFKKFVT